MIEQKCLYTIEDSHFQGWMYRPSECSKDSPAVLVFHDWTGCNEFAQKKAQMLASMGYIALAVDMYGDGRIGTSTDEKVALMTPLMEDRTLLQRRAKAALDALCSVEQVDSSRIAAIGFCFGGLCVLDLARSNLASLRGVVSFHGLLQAPEYKDHIHSNTKVLVLHGYDDPMAEPDAVHSFCEEMRRSNCDWQVHMYGNVLHAFSNPQANDVEMGTVYNPLAEQRALQSMQHFLTSIF